MNEENLISVIVPTYNRADFLPDSLSSIVNQSYRNYEIIVVDDGSTDNTKDVIQKLDNPRIKYIYQKNKGPAAAKNTGLKAAKGNIIAFLDSDDLWPEDKLKNQLEILCNNENFEIIMGGIKHQELNMYDNSSYIDLDETHNRSSLGSGLFKACVFKRTGLFNEELIHWEDIDWLIRAAEKGVKTIKQKPTALIVRIHNNNISRDRESSKKYLSRVLKDSLERRRKNNGGSVENIIFSQWSNANEQ